MRYDGGKNGEGTYQRIINQIPPHRVYVELFAGSAAVLRKKRPAAESWACDLDPCAIAALGEELLPPNTRLMNVDALKLLERTSMGRGWFIYADPPYLPSTRRGGRVYRHELTTGQHRDLLRRLKELDGPMLMVSGYWSDLYARELRDWRTDAFFVTTRGGPATEWLWMNYPEPVELHDYRYLGNDFRQREKIRRQQRRWAAKLARMSPLQRYALLAAIAGARIDGNSEVTGGSSLALSDEGARAGPPSPLAGSGEGSRSNLVASPFPAGRTATPFSARRYQGRNTNPH